MIRILQGDCREVMATLDEASVDSIVCDPPYELGFMGKGWDRTGVANDVETWRQAQRVLKPGGHLLAFGGTRTFHRLACAIEDAGFELRDGIGYAHESEVLTVPINECPWLMAYVYGSGFPKSLDVSKAIDKAAGVRGHDSTRFNAVGQQGERTNGGDVFRSDHPDYIKPQGITDAARQWQGWGTALKPAWEPIVLARKPLQGTVASNVLAHGCGALNIDACRVPAEETTVRAVSRSFGLLHDDGRGKPGGEAGTYGSDAGRWPANIIHDGSDEVLAAFPSDGKVGDGRVKISAGGANRGVSGSLNPSGMNVAGKENVGVRGFGDGGSAARFFYTAKASRHDRNDGVEREYLSVMGGEMWIEKPRKNTHPTVKPTDLMRYLCRLVTPPGGTVLDPFMGSGSTLKAAELEGFSAIGIELDEQYIEIARRRIASDAPLFANIA